MYDKLLVPLDGSEIAELVLPHAIELARRWGSQVTLLQAVDSIEQYQTAQDYLASVAAKFTAEGIDVAWAARIGSPGEEILQYADKDDTRLIVIASHGRSGLAHVLHGSVTEHVMHHAWVPVLYVRSIHEHT